MGSETFAMPEPDINIAAGEWITHQDCHYYSASALRAAVLEALERAAKECDRLTNALDHSGVSYHRPATADRCATVIRQLAEQVKMGVGNG